MFPPKCKLCNLFPDDLDHIFRRCEEAKRVWDELSIPVSKRITISVKIPEWLRTDCEAYGLHQLKSSMEGGIPRGPLDLVESPECCGLSTRSLQSQSCPLLLPGEGCRVSMQ